MDGIMLKGIPASPGIAIGRAFLLGKEKEISIAPRPISEAEVPFEISKFENALLQTRREIENIQQYVKTNTGTEHAEIFQAHLLLLEDRMIIEEVITRLRAEKLCVEYILSSLIKNYSQIFAELDDEYMRGRVADIEDVGKRILGKILNIHKITLNDLQEPSIIIAHNISPSDTAIMPKDKVLGFATDVGSRTSHTAIMARGLEIPAVVGLEHIVQDVGSEDLVILDGSHGIVYINPDKLIIAKYEEEKKRFAEFEKELLSFQTLPCQTKDNHRITLAGNIELPDEIQSVLTHGGEGVGLYRTEFLYLNRTDLPTEEEHYESYRKITAGLKPNPVIIRTLDLGGDKIATQIGVSNETNPYLGWRAIRFCLAVPEIFKTQLRGILRASSRGKIKIMYPMISDLEEVLQANKILNEIKQELTSKDIQYDNSIEVGAMIETPAAVMAADIIAPHVNFFSLGTNDLIQYSLAVDRANEKVAYLYKPLHPGILRMIKNVIDVGHKNGIWVGMCGEMASEPLYAGLLIGLGIDELSVSPIMIPEIKKVIRSMTMEEAVQIAQISLDMKSAEQIEEFLKKKLRAVIPLNAD